MSLPSIFEYLDYRDWFREVFEAKRRLNSHYSLRYLGQCLKLDAGNLLKIHQKKRHLPKKSVALMETEFHLTSQERHYFELLFCFNRALNSDQAKYYYEQILACKNISPKVVGKDQYAFYKNWIHTVVLALLHIEPFRGDYQKWSNRLVPKTTIKEIQQSFDLLIDLGLAKRKGNQIMATESLLTTGEVWKDLAVREFQLQTLRLAEHSLRYHQPENRDVSTLTVTADKESLKKIKDLTRKYRQEVLKVVSDCENPNQVFQLNIQFFPLSVNVEEESERSDS